mmetsp:Transcript_43231/g.69441  ORF Transcript_43231/g.69441 Transcript_43231/m.69441 type:complete len:472 (+) Transcript_43231:119-1534(+)|eukprot:CAMPEP_0179450420 /NCGR_PEP_ID=MMETSP0799-20121207/34369_1 /TAXON_ID=46947 /ORGANISM="Geminigera cryophila, Strain CCMP2564" /LENGTH=471 /DNA_ID=CAMNT_0021244451 /DNA_START=115 /DNA_END=1530 /DNA_ORIENTATION=-
MVATRALFLSVLAVGANSFSPAFQTSSLAPATRVSLRDAPVCGLRSAKSVMIDDEQTQAQTPKKFDPSARGNVRPGTGFVDLITNYAWGQQMPDVALPYPIAPGTPPEAAPMVTQEHLEILERDGCVHIKDVLSEDWLQYLRAVTDWQISHPHIWAVPGVASGLYDYIQRSAWTTNTGFADFLYYSPVASVLAKTAECGWFPEGDARGYHEIRVSTDLLMVNPNKGFKWHQDNQNGPLTCGHGGKLDGLRFWVTMDETPAGYGAPVYLRKSHLNKFVDKDVVFVKLDEGDMPEYANDVVEFRPGAGDMLIWHPRSVHKVDGAPNGDWQGRKRRVLGGTVAVDDAFYQGKKKALFSDMGSHNLQQGDALKSPYFPIIYPQSDASERAFRAEGKVGRSWEGFRRMVGTLWSIENMSQFSSWAKVLQEGRKIKEVNEPFLWRRKVSEVVTTGLERQHKSFEKVREVLESTTLGR